MRLEEEHEDPDPTWASAEEVIIRDFEEQMRGVATIIDIFHKHFPPPLPQAGENE